MEITSRFNQDDFEVWIDHFQYLDIGERHQSVPSGKSFIRGTFDPDQNAYVIDKIHIDPDMLRTNVKEDLLDEAKLQAHKRDKKLLRKRVAAMPVHEPRMRMERNQPADNRPMVRRDLQTAVWRIADSLARSLKDPQGSTPGDARWTVSGLSHSSWAINHPDILTDGESPLTLRIKKLLDNRWVAFGQNRLTNLMNTKILSIKKTPPGGDDWDDIDTFASTSATYFQDQKANILSLKQAMTPQALPGAGYAGQQQGGGGPGGEMGGMGGMMASRQARKRKAASEFSLTPEQAMNALQIKGTGDVNQDKANIREILKRSHSDTGASGPLAKIRMTAINVLNETFIRQNKPLPTTAAQGQGSNIGGEATAGQVNQKVQNYVSQAVSRAGRLQQGLSAPGSRVDPRTVVRSINDMNNFMHGAAVTLQANLGTKDPKTQGLFQRLATASRFLQAAAGVLSQAGPQLNQQVLAEVIKNLNGFVQTGNDALKSTTTKQSRRASATLANLRKAQRIARQIHRVCGSQDWYLGVRVINDRNGIGLGVGAAEPPPRSLKGSLGGIPVVLEGPGARALQAQREAQKHLRLARKLAQEVAEEMEIDPETQKALKHHQRLVRRVYNHIKNSTRLSGSVRYLARKLGMDFGDLVKVIGQLIVEGKIEMTKKKKFRLLPEPHTPVPGMADKFASTNSVFGIDRGRSDKRVDQLLSQSVYQLNMNEPADAYHKQRDVREVPSKIMPDPTQPN